jgi:hypothetical protein
MSIAHRNDSRDPISEVVTRYRFVKVRDLYGGPEVDAFAQIFVCRESIEAGDGFGVFTTLLVLILVFMTKPTHRDIQSFSFGCRVSLRMPI